MTPEKTPRLSCPVSDIDTSDLLRKDLGDIDELCQSIKDNMEAGLPGLIHPVVVDNSMRLLSGSRRLAAHKKLGLTHIDYNFFAVLDESTRIRIEVDANKQKVFTWQERVLGIDKYHTFYSNEAALKGDSWGIRESGRLLKISRSYVGRIIFLAEYLKANDEEILKADNIEDAYKILVKRAEIENEKLLVQQSMPKPLQKRTLPTVSDDDFYNDLSMAKFTPTISGPTLTNEKPGGGEKQVNIIDLSSTLLKEDHHNSLTVLEGLGPDCCDHIITDPPYGIDMDNLQQTNQGQDVSSTAVEHDVQDNLELLRLFFPVAYRAIRDKGFLIMWTDVSNWDHVTFNAEAAGFRVQRWPLIWHKTSSCSNQSSGVNFTKNFEVAMICRKGNATLINHQKSSIWTGGNDIETRLLGHPFAKPFALWQWLYEATCMKGAKVIDPFVGRGSSMIPAIRFGLQPIGIECNEAHYNGLVTNIQNLYKSIDPSCTFK